MRNADELSMTTHDLASSGACSSANSPDTARNTTSHEDADASEYCSFVTSPHLVAGGWAGGGGGG
jgi:hypothetical protein